MSIGVVILNDLKYFSAISPGVMLMHEKFRRPVLSGERLWLAGDSAAPPFVNQMVLEGVGSLDEECLRDAVAKASEANPGCRLVIKGALRSAYWLDSGVDPPVHRIRDSKWDGYSHHHATFLNKRLPCHGPTCEVVWVEGEKQRLIFRSNHGAMDGRGCVIWAEDVFRALRGEELLGSRSSVSKLDIITGITDQTKAYDSGKVLSPTGNHRPGEPGVMWRRVSFTGKFHKLLGKMGWVLAQSAWRYNDGPVRLLIPVDLRSRRPGLRSTSNLNAGLTVEVTKDSTPDSIARDIATQLENKEDCVRVRGEDSNDRIPLTVFGAALKVMSKLHHRQGRYLYSALVSNLGIIDAAKFYANGFRTETVFFIPPKAEIIPVFLTLTGCSGREEVCLSVPHALGSDNRFERLLDDMCRILTPDAVQMETPRR